MAKIIILNLKGIFSNRSSLFKVFILLAILFTSFFVHHLLALGLISLLFENGFNLFFSYDLASQTSVNVLKIVQLFSAAGTFITPILIYGYLTNFNFGINTFFSRQSAVLAISIIIIITPLITYLIELSMSIEFPFWLQNFDRDSEPIVLAFLKMNGFSDLIFNLLIMAIIPAFGEELFFRGFLQNTFLNFFKSSHLAIVITSILFSLIHFDLEGFIPRLFLGAILGYMFLWTQSLWVPIIAHFVNNALAIIISYPYFKSYEIVQNFNHYGESSLPNTSLGAIIFSLVSVSVLLYLLYSNSIRVKQEN